MRPILLAALLATGCATAPQVPLVMAPPAVLLQDCLVPPPNVKTNEDLLQWALSMRSELRKCNIDKAALREWAAGNQGDSK